MGNFTVLNFERGSLRIRRMTGNRYRTCSNPDNHWNSTVKLINLASQCERCPDSPVWIKGSIPPHLASRGLVAFCTSPPLNFTPTQITTRGVWWWSIYPPIDCGFWLSGCNLFSSPAKAGTQPRCLKGGGGEAKKKRSWKVFNCSGAC